MSKLNSVKLQKLEKQKVCMFFEHNKALGPPYRVLLDTNFINFSIKNKIEMALLPALAPPPHAACMTRLTSVCCTGLSDCPLVLVTPRPASYRPFRQVRGMMDCLLAKVPLHTPPTSSLAVLVYVPVFELST